MSAHPPPGPRSRRGKLNGKNLQRHRQTLKENEAREIQELGRRIQEEAPPAGSNPLSFDDPANSFVPDGPPSSSASSAAAASASSAAAAAAPSTARAASANGARPVIYAAVRKFSELPLSSRTQAGLAAAGFTRLTDIQRAAIAHALAGRDVLGAARTGSGKTLAYLIPLLELLFRESWGKADGVGGLVIAPTRELAMQIFDVLRGAVGKQHMYSAGLVIGGKDVEEEAARIGSMNILVCTPGRLLQHFESTVGFNVDNLRMLVLDEADRILDMGFSQTMSDILTYLPPPPQRQTLLFSATQTKSLKELAKLSLKNPEYIAVHEAASLAIPNKLVQSYTFVPAETKLNTLHAFIKTHLQAKTIVFLSSGKQVRFIYEMFRRIRPGVPLTHIHGKMKQAKRMAIYYDFCNKKHALMFCTDVAARGLDFPDVDWVLQMDAPENVATYIHRVGRTARYRSDGKAMLFLCPSESAFVEELNASNKILSLKKVRADASKLKDMTSTFASFLAQDSELKFLAQKAFISYVRSIALQQNKKVFKAEEIPFEELAKSMGLPGTPKVKLPKGSSASILTTQKEKNMPHQLRELMKHGSKAILSSSSKSKQNLSAVEKILVRKNTTVFSDARAKLRAGEDSEDEDSSEDEVLKVKRRDHELDDDDDDDDEMEVSEQDISSESGEESEEKEETLKSKKKKQKEPSKPIETKPETAIDESASFVSLAKARVEAEDPMDRQREHERVRAKHQAKKAAIKRARQAEMEEDDDGEGPMVVTLGRGSDEEQDEMDDEKDNDDDDGQEEMSDNKNEGDDDNDDGSDESQSNDDEEDSADETAAASSTSSKKRKASAAQPPSSKKQKGKSSTPTSLADQEALALKLLGVE